VIKVTKYLLVPWKFSVRSFTRALGCKDESVVILGSVVISHDRWVHLGLDFFSCLRIAASLSWVYWAVISGVWSTDIRNADTFRFIAFLSLVSIEWNSFDSHSITESPKRRDEVINFNISTTESMNERISSSITENKNTFVFHIHVVKWESIILVLQENSWLLHTVLSKINTFFGGDIGIEIVFSLFIEKSKFNEWFYNSVNSLVNFFNINFFESSHVIESWPSLFLITSSWNVRISLSINSSPIAHHKTIESHDFSQVIVKCLVVLAWVNLVDLVIAAHCWSNSSVNWSLEWRVVNFKVGSLIHVCTLCSSISFLVVIDPVLHVGHNTSFLHSLGDGTSKFSTKKRVLSRNVFEISSVSWDSSNIQSWS